jgi:hypothetical protein
MYHLYFMLSAVGIAGLLYVWNNFKEIDCKKINTIKALKHSRYEEVEVEVIKKGYYVNYEYPNKLLDLSKSYTDEHIDILKKKFIRTAKLRILELDRDNVTIMFRYKIEGEWCKSALITPLNIDNYDVLKNSDNITKGYYDKRNDKCYLNIPNNKSISEYYANIERALYKQVMYFSAIYIVIFLSISVI